MNLFGKVLPNLITLLRVILTCIINIHILNQHGGILVPGVIFLVILYTDFLDGKIARLLGGTTKFGAVFDVLADFFFIVTIYIVLHNFDILPLWFLIIILFKFLEFLLTSFLFKKISRIKTIFIFDVLGRFVAGLFYIIPITAYILFSISKPIYFVTIDVLIYSTTVLAIFSTINRLWSYLGKSRQQY